MRVCFDHGTPSPLRMYLTGHTVLLAKAQGWDKNMRYQQNLAGRTIAIVVLPTPQWPVLLRHVTLVLAAVNAATAGSYTEVEIPA